jgi:hypothetical protein
MPQHDHLGPNQPRQSGDDFRKISGIGTVLAQRLWDAGILTYEDLAQRTPEEIATVLDVPGISPERIASQNWIRHARDLAGTPPEPSAPRQHYAAFHVEFLLESDNRVRRTKVHHHETDARDAWPGWDEGRLLTFLRERIPLPATTQPVGAPDLEPPDIQAGAEPPASAPSTPTPQPPPVAMREDLPSSFLDIEELTPIGDGQRSDLRRPDEPNLVRLIMRLNPIGTPIHETFDFSATIAARELGARDRLPVATTHGAIRVSDAHSVEVAGWTLPVGLYRLLVTVDIYPAGHSSEEPPLYSRAESGDLLQVTAAPDGLNSAAA